jgi:hypothetical protein
MRKFFYISALVLLYLLVTAKSCDNQEKSDEARDRDRIKLTQDSIRATFESDTLSDAALRAFEGNAIMKLSDFSDYLDILQDTSKAKPFRDKAREMISRLFISEISLIRISKPNGPGRGEYTVRRFLQDAGIGTIPFGRIISDSVRVIQGFVRAGDSMYAGKLSYFYMCSPNNPSEGSGPSPAKGTVEFFLKQHEKTFGTDTLMIWDVFLGNME